MYLSRGPRLARMLSTASHEVFDVAVVGAGVVGAALACALKCEAHPTAPSQAERAHGWLAATRDQQVCVRVLVQGG
jgi:hypothetical protein